MANIFNSVKLKRPRRNVFNLSYENKLTANAGELVPIMCKPVVPGDKFRVNTEMLVRLAPLVAPMMHRVDVFTHYFFVPNRLLWNQWEDFITKGVDGIDTPVFPKIALRPDWVNPTSAAVLLDDGSLWDYLGLPTIGGFNNVAFPNRSPNSDLHISLVGILHRLVIHSGRTKTAKERANARDYTTNDAHNERIV
jgi:hypothetical protein